MSGTRVWVNGRLTRVDEPAVTALDHGVTVGDGAFETLKVEGGKPFAPTRHLRRLDRTMAGLGLPPADHGYLAQGIAAVLDSDDPVEYGRLRYSITGGAGPLGSDRDDSPMTYIVTSAEQPRPPASGAVCVVPWTRNERSAVAGLKTTSYAENVIALAYAKERGGVEALFANTRGELCEGTGTNVFVVVDGVILTPPLESGCLAGITRELTLEWCRETGLPVREQAMPVGVLREADEVFITSSTKDLLPVHAVDDRALDPGPLTKQAAEVFARLADQRQDP
jgi:branched-chain amino acid aminotransferase